MAIALHKFLPPRFGLFAHGALAAALCFGVAFAPIAAPVHAQPSSEMSAQLRDAIGRLARDPQNLSALLDAGSAAIEIGDADAAAGFLMRAEAVAPSDGRLKALLGRAKLRQEDPVEALRLFDEAMRLGQPESGFAADKGLAYDLVGDMAAAQRTYQLAQRTNPSTELSLRMAISQDLAGNKQAADRLLTPLLTANERGAWRAQAFLYAAHGDLEKARSVATSFLGAAKASQLEPYFARMPQLTVAQQMAAIHYGHFPIDNIGADEPAIAAIQRQRGIAGGAPASGSRTTSGQARPPSFIDFRGRKQTNVSYVPPGRTQQNPAVARAATATPAPAATPRQALATAGRNAEQSTSRAPAPAQVSLPTPVAAARPPEPPMPAAIPASAAVQPTATAIPPTAPAPATTQAPPRPAVREMEQMPDLADIPSSNDAQRRVASAPVARQERDLSSLLSGIAIPESERRQDVVPVTEEMIPDNVRASSDDSGTEKPAEQYPAREWVQIATGGDVSRLAFDYRRFSKANADLFSGVSGWTSPWGGRRRMVVGPFETLAAANDWQRRYAEAGGDSFVWQSDDGTVVEPLPAR